MESRKGASLPDGPEGPTPPDGRTRTSGNAAPRRPDSGTLPQPPRSVPETRPTPLQPHYIELSVVALVCGVVAITALEFGAPLDSLLVRSSVLIDGALLALTMADALLRVWRAAWAWMPIDRGKGLFRLSWVAAIVALYGALIVVVWAVVAAGR